MRGPLHRISDILRIWDLSTFHPIILRINAHPMETEYKVELFKLLESYIIRREICGLTTKNYNKVVTGMVRQLIDGAEPVAALKKHLAELSGDASRMPTDLHVAEAFARQKAYGVIPVPRLRYILQHLEYGSRTKFDEVTVSANNLTVEHVMPRRWAQHWPLPNGTTAPSESTFAASITGQQLSDEIKSEMDSRERVIDTFGNLTLLTEALNPSVGNGAWSTKKSKFAGSLLVLNRAIAACDTWDENAIKLRAAELVSVANRLWPLG